MSITKLSIKGQITIPKEVRDKLELESADRILVEVKEHLTVIRPPRKHERHR